MNIGADANNFAGSCTMPTVGNPAGMVGAYRDLYPPGAGFVRDGLTGVAPNRVYFVEWNGAGVKSVKNSFARGGGCQDRHIGRQRYATHTLRHTAATWLMQAGADLRRSLESQGVTVHGLDVHLSGDSRGENANGERAADMARAMGPNGGGSDADADEAEITIQPSQLPLSGSQIDVLA